MIDSVSAGSKYLHTGNASSAGPYVSANESVPMHGVVRYVNQTYQVYNGGGWINIYGGQQSIGLNSDAVAAIDWAIQKMIDERRIAELAKSNPTVADAAENLKKAQEQLDIVVALSSTQGIK